MTLTYTGGEATWCPYGTSRSLSLELVCAPVVGTPASYSLATCREKNTCSYTVQLPSIAGCPTQCRAPGDVNVCSSQGVCGYNADAGKSQCYCFDGFTGALCGAKAAAPGMSVETILLIVVCSVLALVLAAVAYMGLKLRRLNVNPAAYGNLQGRYNELGQMSL